MNEWYLGFLIGGVCFAFLSVVLGELIGSWLDGIFDGVGVDIFKPIVLATCTTVFGGTGLLLQHYSQFGPISVFILSVAVSLSMCVLVYFGYIKPAERSEVSTGYSEKELSGRIGEVTIPIPETGYGEIMVSQVSGRSLHIAGSWERRPISAGIKVVVVDVQEGIVLVSRLS